MAKRRKGKSRRASISRKSYFKKKTTRRKSGSRVGWMPIDTNELLTDFATGAIVGPLNEQLRPLQAQYLGAFGQYSDEAGLAIVGIAVHKFGGKIHPQVKKIGKELFRVAVIGAGQGMGSDLVRGMISRFGGNANASTQNAAVGGSFR